MDYEHIKAIITARMKQWQGQAERCQKLQAEMPIADALEPIISVLVACVTACTIILQDIETAHDIFDRH